MLLYHGSPVIVEKPEIRTAKFHKDFYFGFYCTEMARKDVVEFLGDDLKRIYSHADVFHCEPIEKVADDFIGRNAVKEGDYDPVSRAKYPVPDYWDIGEVYSRLIEDCYKDGDDLIQILMDVYSSWISDAISNYNSDMFYQPRDYIYECYKEGKICA